MANVNVNMSDGGGSQSMNYDAEKFFVAYNSVIQLSSIASSCVSGLSAVNFGGLPKLNTTAYTSALSKINSAVSSVNSLVTRVKKLKDTMVRVDENTRNIFEAFDAIKEGIINFGEDLLLGVTGCGSKVGTGCVSKREATEFEKGFLSPAAKGSAKEILKKINKVLWQDGKYKDFKKSGIFGGLTGLFVDALVDSGIGYATGALGNGISGKDFDPIKELKKSGGKAIPGVVAGLVTYAVTGGKETKPDDAIKKLFKLNGFDLSDFKKGTVYETLKSSEKGRNIFKRTKDAFDKNTMTSGKLAYNAWEKQSIYHYEKKPNTKLWKNLAKADKALERSKSASSFVKNIGGGMAASAGVDAILSIGGNILKNKLTDGKSLLDGEAWKEAAKGSEWGQEILKSSTKAVCQTAGYLIGGCVGCPDAGKAIGGVVAGVVNEHITKPFKDKDGNTQEGWCAGAGAAVLAGGIGGGAAAAAMVCAATPPVGWAVGAGIVVGAAVGYGITCAAHYVSEHKEEIKETVNKAVDTVKEGINKAADTVVEGAKKAGKWIKGLFGG